MNDDHRDTFADLIEGLGLTFDKEVTAPLCEIYFRALMRFSIQDITSAVNLAVTSCKFFPKPVELIELIEGSPDEEAMGAWVRLEEARSKVGYFNSIWIEEAALSQSVIDTFGSWVLMCETLHVVLDSESGRQIGGLSPEMVRAKQKEFAVNYRRAKRDGKCRTHYHAGKCEIENSNTVGGWSRGMLAEGFFYQPLGIIGKDSIRTIQVPFDATTGRLVEEVRQQLESGKGHLIKQISGARPKLLTEGEASPLEPRGDLTPVVREITQAKRFKASEMTEQDAEKRRQLLREQAKLLLKEQFDGHAV
jgi:hypothetical protein